jgi:hypothetical protein
MVKTTLSISALIIDVHYIYHVIRSSGDENISVFIFITTIARQIITVKFAEITGFETCFVFQMPNYFQEAMAVLQPPTSSLALIRRFSLKIRCHTHKLLLFELDFTGIFNTKRIGNHWPA